MEKMDTGQPEQPVDALWQRIRTWLEVNAPATASALVPGATEDEIAMVAKTMGIDLPDDLVRFWRCLNGTSEETAIFPHLYDPISTAAALDERSTWLLVMDDLASWGDVELAEDRMRPAGSEAGTFVTKFLPISSNYCGCHLVVDLRAGPWHGCVIDYDKVEACGPPLWASTAAMLADIADALEQGTRLRSAVLNDLRPRVVDGALEWDED